MSVFAITTIGFEKNGDMRRRTVGIFPSEEEACRILDGNYGDLNEAGWYPWAVVEEVKFGLYPIIGYEYEKSVFYYYLKSATYHNEEGWKKLDGCPDEINDYVKRGQLAPWFVEIG